MGTDRYKATSMNRLSLNYRIETMSEEMKALLDEIYVLSRSGKFSIEVEEIDKDDIELLRALGYRAEEKWIPTEITEYIGERAIYRREKRYIVSWS